MAKVSGEIRGWFSIFQEGPITWMAPPEVLEGEPGPSWPPHFLSPCMVLQMTLSKHYTVFQKSDVTCLL